MASAPILKSSFLLGFNEIERTAAGTARTASDGYPPYNIERFANNGADRLRITLAVAGFTAAQLEITEGQGQLAIRGRQSEGKARVYLHRGIAARQFQRVFHFAEAMQVAGAALDHGLLCIELVRPEAERAVQKIDITVRD